MNDLLQETISSNFKFYKRMSDDRDFASYFVERLFEQYVKGTEPRS